MPYDKLLDFSTDPIFQELQDENNGTSLDSIETVIRFLRVATFINTKRDSILSSFGLTSGRFHLLMLLKRETKRALSPSELAKRTEVTRGTMTQFIDAIERDGFVKRVEDPNDKRGMLVELTSLGEEKLKTVLPHLIKQMEHFTSVLDVTERKTMLNLMEKMVDSMRATSL